jgi:formate dehydrogenase assembly factor FdhD
MKVHAACTDDVLGKQASRNSHYCQACGGDKELLHTRGDIERHPTLIKCLALAYLKTRTLHVMSTH